MLIAAGFKISNYPSKTTLSVASGFGFFTVNDKETLQWSHKLEVAGLQAPPAQCFSRSRAEEPQQGGRGEGSSSTLVLLETLMNSYLKNSSQLQLSASLLF